MSVPWMSDNRPAAADGCSLCKRCVFARAAWLYSYSWVEGMVRKWLVLRVCGVLTLMVW